ncbi:MAG: nitrate- and nitrite sensing domain-containing protein [Chromatiales bacterium]|nr:nitrate- and nitrite sensing domain-containing protein [Chromatiales bacterium]
MTQDPILWIASGGLAGFAGWKLWKRLGQKKRRCFSEEASLVLLDLMRDLQRHRALSGALIDGQVNFTGDREHTERRLGQALYSMQEHYCRSHGVFDSDQWKAVLYRWETVRQEWRGLEFLPNLFAHSDVIVGLIGIVQTLAEKDQSTLGTERAAALGNWPVLIEYFGMMRALGMHFLRHSRTSQAELIAENIADYRQQAERSLLTLGDSLPSAEILNRSDCLLRQVDRFLESQGKSWDAQSYYQEFTSVIDRWFAITKQTLRTPTPTPEATLPAPMGESHLPTR